MSTELSGTTVWIVFRAEIILSAGEVARAGGNVEKAVQDAVGFTGTTVVEIEQTKGDER